MTSTRTTSDLDAYLDRTYDRRLASYLDFLRIPSISALPEHAGDCRAAAEWLVARLRDIGLDNVEASETGGHPIVYADWLHADGAPTVIAYGHYDVQPVDPLDEWVTAPFEPTVDGDRVRARGASDDKANISILVQTVEALLAIRGSLPVNLRFVFEGEEESSSIHLEPWLAANKGRLGGDIALICDGGFFTGNVPAVTIALRGMMYAQIDVQGPFQDVHSGAHGGSIENPAHALAVILASLKNEDGSIAVEGFYDDVVPLSEADRSAYAALPFDEEAQRAALSVPALVGEPGYSTLERRSGRPTLDINGMWSGFTGEGSKTIIPGRAHAKISSRLVADQDPERVFELVRAHIERVTPPGVTVDVHLIASGRPSLTPIDRPANQALARALAEVFGREAVFVREGGSIPFVAVFEEQLEVPVVVMGFVPPDGNFHAPNEWMDLRNFEGGIRTMVRYWDELATIAR
jgi:acetylornithine deacetylase/succinyl-diaminopimelate desuccinylase-like protein